MTATPHTALPWQVTVYRDPAKDNDPMGVYVVKPAAHKLTHLYFALDPEIDAHFDNIVHGENTANASFIQRACNNHYKLLRAGQAIINNWDRGDLAAAVRELDALIREARRQQ